MGPEPDRGRSAPLSRRALLRRTAGATTLLAAPTGVGSAQATPPTERWRYAPGDVSNTIGHDGAYYVTAGETIQAIDATSGELLWTAGTDGAVREGAAAIDPSTSTLVAAGETGTAVGVALGDGRERWRRSVGGSGIGVAVDGGTAYLLSDGSVAAVAAAAGDRAWRHSVPDGVATGSARGLSVATAGSDAIPVYHTGRYVVGLDGSGAERWRVELPVPSFANDVFVFNDNNTTTQGQYIYYQSDTGPADGDRHGVVDAAAGELVWERLDEYTDLSELRGGPTTFDGNVVTSGAEATVLSIPGGRVQWRTGVATYDGATGTENALYVAGNAGGTAVLRSFGSGGTVNWTVEFGEYDAYEDGAFDDTYQFHNLPPAVTDGSILLGADPGGDDPSLRCYELPESEWLAAPQREPTAGTPASTPTDRPDSTPAGSGTDGPEASVDQSGGTTPDRGFFTNGAGGPLSGLSGTNLTVLSTAITVVGIVVTVYDLIRGGED